MRHLTATFAFLLLVGPLGAPSVAQEQTETLADIRQELSVLFVELQRLKREMNTTGSPAANVAGTTLDRVNLIESELQRLISTTEELDFPIASLVPTGTNQIGDLEFRICELEPGCDVSQLDETPTFGGGELPQGAAVAPAVPAAPADQGATSLIQDQEVELAVAEKADFERAEAAITAGQYEIAAEILDGFTTTYPGSPLAGEAQFLRGQANAGMGDWKEAARAYLESFSGAPDGPVAPQALLNLGISLGELGQTQEACITLAEVSTRFPGDAAEIDAQTAMSRFSCG